MLDEESVVRLRVPVEVAPTRALGDLPYLNGGLSERHALERSHSKLALPDEIVLNVFEDVLERYRVLCPG